MIHPLRIGVAEEFFGGTPREGVTPSEKRGGSPDLQVATQQLGTAATSMDATPPGDLAEDLEQPEPTSKGFREFLAYKFRKSLLRKESCLSGSRSTHGYRVRCGVVKELLLRLHVAIFCI